MESYELLQEKNINVLELLEWHFLRITASARRTISFKQEYQDPWTIKVVEPVVRSVFIEAFRAIRDYKISYGRKINVVRDNKGIAKVYCITFTHFGALNFHIRHLTREKVNIAELFSKKSSVGNTASVVLSEEKHGILTFNVSKSIFTLELSYAVNNQYGIVCSF